jgi:hypothetical protein
MDIHEAETGFEPIIQLLIPDKNVLTAYTRPKDEEVLWKETVTRVRT